MRCCAQRTAKAIGQTTAVQVWPVLPSCCLAATGMIKAVGLRYNSGATMTASAVIACAGLASGAAAAEVLLPSSAHCAVGQNAGG